MRKLGKLISVLAVLAMLTALFAVVPVSAEEERLYFTANASTNNTDGGYYASGVGVSAYGEQGIIMDGTGASTPRCLWAFTNGVIDKYPYLHFELETPENTTKITFTKYWGGEPEVEYTDLTGPKCINLLTLLQGQDTIGYTYVVPYVNVNTQLKIKYMYLSNVDENGNIYVKPTQPRAMWNVGGTMQRFDLPAYTQDTLYEMVDETYGYGWLMSAGIKISNHEDGKGFWMERAENSKLQAINIAWVVPYEQLEKTPYLVLDIANEGRSDEGPQINVFAYWEGIVGSAAAPFDGMETVRGANGLNGVNAFNLKYVIDNVKEELHGPYGIAIIVSLDLSKERSDGTVLDPLKINDAYLMGWEGGEESEFTFAQVMNGEVQDPATTTTGTSATTTVANQNGDGNDKANDNDNGWIVWAVVGAVVVVVAVVAVIVIKKKK